MSHADCLQAVFRRTVPAVPIRGVHLDLKGLPPTFDRLMRHLEIFAELRFNVVLIEWEDMFPWTFDTELRSASCYSPDQVRALAQQCGALGLEVIPLVQCLGHLENALRLPRYAHMREISSRADCLSPLAPGARQLVDTMVDDVLALLPDIRHLHLGGDEAWVFGTHPDTHMFVRKHGKAALYLQHVEPTLDRLLQNGIRPILWHDMMIEWDRADLSRLAAKADLMVWGYRGTPDDHTHHHRREVLDAMAEANVSMWGGSAYKGADGPHRDLPNAEARLVNHVGWAEASQVYGLRGVITTGWSRYAASRVQNEPIDACLPELAMAALVLHDGEWLEKGWATCNQLLKVLQEDERVTVLRKHLTRLTTAREEAWMRGRQLKEHLAGLEVDATRYDGGMAAFLFEHFEPWVAQVETLADEVPELLAGLVYEPAATMYGRSWAIALRREANDLVARIAAHAKSQANSRVRASS